MKDIVMTGEANANRTFRSIFGDKEKRQDERFSMDLEQSDSSRSSHLADSTGTEIRIHDDEYDEMMWKDELLVNGDATEENNNDVAVGLHFAQRKSMEEWADDDDEEETWKEALQDRVNELELAFQYNDDLTATSSRRQLEQHQVQHFSAHDIQRTDFSQSSPVSTRFVASGEEDTNWLRQTSRHKMRRTSSSNACITGDNVVATNCPNRLWSFPCKVAGETARNTMEHHRKRSGSLSGSESRLESPHHLVSRKPSFDNSRNSLSQISRSRSFCGIKAVSPSYVTSLVSSSARVLNLSDTEAIRRFVLEDVKTMSMERLVSDARRLHFLDDFYQSQQGLPSVTTSPAVSQLSLASSSSAMSTS